MPVSISQLIKLLDEKSSEQEKDSTLEKLVDSNFESQFKNA